MQHQNLIIIHLESLNRIVYDSNPHLFLNLNNFSSQCIRYRNYFSTATSTYMTIGDMSYGSMLQYEHCKNLKSTLCNYIIKQSLFDELKNNGYQTNGILFPNIENAVLQNMNKRNILGFSTHLDGISNRLDYFNKIKEYCSNKNNFALFISDMSSHLSAAPTRKKRARSSILSWETGYKLIDHTLGYIINVLKENNILDNTVLIIYGDHGNDFWEHSLHNGYCHATEPYSSLIHTPLMVYKNDLGSSDCYDIVSTIDIKPLALSLLGMAVQSPNFIYNQYHTNRKYAFSRNLFANQDINQLTFNKSYSVVDSNYLLLVNHDGLEMYSRKIDPSNHCNLLEFFTFSKKQSLKFSTKFYNLRSRHFSNFMTEQYTKEIEKCFSRLLKILKKEVRLLYQHANGRNCFKEMNFYKINSQNNYKYYASNIYKFKTTCMKVYDISREKYTKIYKQ